jgi:pimeloyl-ACP methyl ester carboxylesterase
MRLVSDEIDTAVGRVALLNCPSDGPTLLWVHGYTLDSSLWPPIWEHLPEFAHVALDLPGHGSSRPYRRGDSLSTSAEAVLEVAAAFGADRLVAMSFGGTVALLAMAAEPQRFRAAVLAAPALPGGPQDQDTADCNQELLRLYRERGVGPWLAERWLAQPPAIFEGARRSAPLFAEITAVVGRHTWGELGLPPIAARADSALVRRLRAVSAQTLLLLGEEDLPSFVRTAELLRRELVRSEIFWVRGAGHLALLERPEACAALIRRQALSTATFGPPQGG